MHNYKTQFQNMTETLIFDYTMKKKKKKKEKKERKTTENHH